MGTKKSNKLYAAAAALAVTASAVAPGLTADAASKVTVKSVTNPASISHYGGYTFAVKKLSLPKTVKVLLSNKKYENRSVKWGKVSYDKKYIGKYQTISGTVSGTTKKASIKVKLNNYPVDVVEPKLAPVAVGEKLNLPSTIDVKYKDGKVIARSAKSFNLTAEKTDKAGMMKLSYNYMGKNSSIKGSIAYEVKAAEITNVMDSVKEDTLSVSADVKFPAKDAKAQLLIFPGKDESKALPAIDGKLEGGKFTAEGKMIPDGTHSYSIKIGDIVTPAKEFKVDNAAKVESVSAVTSKSLKVTFNKAVDDTKAMFEVKKDGFKVNSSTISFSADKKTATVELTSKITKGEYAVSVSGLTQSALTGSVVTQDETVSNIEILSETAPLDSLGKTATVGYKVVNQYGEDITKLTNLEKSAGGAKADIDGLGKITLTPSGNVDFKEGDKVVITLIHPSTAKSVTKTITISASSKIADLTIGALYNKDGKTINEDTDLSKDLFYLPVAVKDQYGNAVTEAKRLNGLTSEVLLNNANPTVVEFGAFEVIKINNVDTLVLPVKGVKDNKATVGESFVTLIAKSNGKSAQSSVKVSESVRSDVVNLQAPSALVVANEEILFPISITDKEGKAITDVKVATDVVKGAKVTSGNGTIVAIDGALYVKVVKESVKENAPITVVVQSSTNKVATQTVIPKAVAAPKVITGTTLSTQSLRPGKSLDVTYDKLKIEDQYGRVMSKEALAGALNAGYSIKATAGENANITLGNKTITTTDSVIQVLAKAGVTTKVSENITFTLVDTKKDELKTSAFDTKFNLVPDAEFSSYEVADLGTIYLPANKTIDSKYAKEIVVKAVTKDGQKVKLDAGKDYTVKSTTLVDVDNNNKIDSTDATNVDYGDASTATAKVTVTINSTGEEFVKEVKFSKEAPKVTKVELVENNKADEFIAGGDVDTVTVSAYDKSSAFNLDELEKLADVVVTDQYGVSVALDEDTEVAKFTKADVTQPATVTFTKVSGDVTFASNGTTTAAVKEIGAGSVFNVRVNVSGVAGTIAKVTAKQAYSNISALLIAEKNLSDAKTAESTAKTAYDTATAKTKTTKTAYDTAVTEEVAAKTAYDTAVTEEASAKTAYENVDDADVAKKEAAKTAYDNATAKKEAAKTAYDTAVIEEAAAKKAYDDAVKTTEEAQASVDKLKA
ncbi:Ig-like domain-containing protein [uncultured Exiguobacterium sp.]|uniref:Ig-like domain-containing protein n=1 Tax=uncultured Exiguobacterium sp. TaxID=202669 RepID=UPI0025D40EFD|nr:Ig-like domain-containing protein [uncultured Exiguobacterium sp.]